MFLCTRNILRNAFYINTHNAVSSTGALTKNMPQTTTFSNRELGLQPWTRGNAKC